MSRTLSMAIAIGVVGRRAARPGAAAAGGRRAQDRLVLLHRQMGFQDEFLDLFQRNHYPILKELEKAGHYLSVRTFVPENHGDGRADWTFAVELVEPAKRPAAPTEEEMSRKLYPDRAKLAERGTRRFELLVAHWDVPLNRIDLGTRTPAASALAEPIAQAVGGDDVEHAPGNVGMLLGPEFRELLLQAIGLEFGEQRIQSRHVERTAVLRRVAAVLGEPDLDFDRGRAPSNLCGVSPRERTRNPSTVS